MAILRHPLHLRASHTAKSRTLSLLWCVAAVALSVIAPLGLNRASAQQPSLVPQVGSIMRGYGKTEKNPEWEQAAKLQDLWLNQNKHTAAPKPPDVFDFSVVNRSDTTKITLDWILKKEVDSDGRAQKAYDELKKAIADDPGKKMQAAIEKQVNRMFTTTSANSVELGSVKLDAKTDIRAFHTQHVQFRGVTESITTPIDPLLGALGSFNFYAIPTGNVEKLADGTCRVDITEFVIYVIDSFDFVGEQKLGYWKAPDSIAKTPFGGGTEITNKSYRDYRDSPAANGKGGDFILITDTKTEKIVKTFTFTPEATANGTWVSSDAKKRFALAIKEESVEWTETSPETGITYKTTLKVTKKGDEWRIERPNNTAEILKMLGFQDAKLQDAILKSDPHPSTLVFQLQKSQLLAKWSGIRVKKTPKGDFSSLVQPEDPAYKPSDYTLVRTK